MLRLLRVRTGVGLLVLVLLACGPSAAQRQSQTQSAPAASAPASGATSASASAPAGDGLQALIDGARREGQLTFVWGSNTFGGTEGIEQLAAGFNRTYGLNVNVQFTPGPSMPQMAARLAQESKSGRPTSSDLLVGYATTMLAAVQADVLERPDWTAWAPNIRDPRLLTAGGAGVAFQTSVGGITYNTTKLRGEQVPRTLQDLLKPEYKGRLASTPYAAYFDLLSTDEMWGKERAYEYVGRLSDQVSGLIRCNESERLVSGEYDVFAIDCSQSEAFHSKATGGPLDFVVPADAPLLLYLYLGVPRNAPHPNAAKLWANYVLGREAQDTLYATDFQDVHFLPGSKTAKDIADVERTGARLTTVTVEYLQAQDEQEFQARRTRVQEILTRK